MEEGSRNKGMQELSILNYCDWQEASFLPAFHSLELILSLFKGTEEHQLYFFQLLQAELKLESHHSLLS